MDSSEPGEELAVKRSAARSLWRVQLPGNGAAGARLETRALKRFHHPGLSGRLLDGRRARREQAILSELVRHGLRVPRPFALRQTAQGWELELEWIEQAQSLEARLALATRARPWSLPRGLGRQLGALLAGIANAGVDARDLHAGNLLLDAQGQLWAIDFHHARQTVLGPEQLLAPLVALAGLARERVQSADRAPVFDAWWAGLSAARRAVLGEPLAVARSIEARAPRARREAVEHNLGRWRRSSGRIELRRDCNGQRWLVRRSATQSLDLERLAVQQTQTAKEAWLESPGEGGWLLRAAPAELKLRWSCAARLAEHALPALRPCALGLESGLAFFDLPEPTRERPKILAGPPEAVALGRCLGALHQLGLDLEPAARAFARTGGELLLLPPLSLESYDEQDLGASAQRAARHGLNGAGLASWEACWSRCAPA